VPTYFATPVVDLPGPAFQALRWRLTRSAGPFVSAAAIVGSPISISVSGGHGVLAVCESSGVANTKTRPGFAFMLAVLVLGAAMLLSDCPSFLLRVSQWTLAFAQLGVTTRKCSECTTSGTLKELRP
jgi:hypothetical protein